MDKRPKKIAEPGQT